MSKFRNAIAKVLTFLLAKVTPADTRSAQEIVAKYRNAGNGSNRTKWDRVTVLLSAVLTAIRTGRAVEVTDLLTGKDGTNDERDTKSPAYHQVHRALSHGAIRPYWHKVEVVALVDATTAKGSVTGTSSTTAKVGQARVFVVPVTK